MNKHIIFFLIVLSIVGCRSTKKVVQSSVNEQKQTEIVQSVQVNESANIINDKQTNQETVTVITEYYPPSVSDKDKLVEKGAIKSVSVTTVKNVEVDRGKTEVVKEKNEAIKTSIAEKKDETIKIKEIKKPGISKVTWLLIFSGVILLVAYIFRNNPFVLSIHLFFKNLFRLIFRKNENAG